MNDFSAKILMAICLGLLPVVGQSQICSGSLGDPVINIDFGKGPNPGPALSNNLPNLTYQAFGCPNDGFYTIANSSGDCFGNTWHYYSSDHTPDDDNGYMMIINASVTSGDFYVDTVQGLCAGTTYEFAAWITNMFSKNTFCATPSRPNLQFSIESVSGTILATYNTGDIAEATSAVWKQYGLFFTTPSNSQAIVLRIANKAPGGCGNDLALDDITFRPCGPSLQLSSPGFTGNLIPQCVDSTYPVTMQLQIGAGFQHPATLWQQSTNAGNSWTDLIPQPVDPLKLVYKPTGIGTTLFRTLVAEAGNIGTAQCRIASTPITLMVHDLPNVQASSNSPVCEKNTLVLTGVGGELYSWKGPNGFSSSERIASFPASLTSEGTYNLVVTDGYGCKGTRSIMVDILEKPRAMAPSIITSCENLPVVLAVSGGSRYQWSPSTDLSADNVSSPTAIPTASRRYTIIVGNDAGCADTVIMQVDVLKWPTADAGPDKYLVEGLSTRLEGKATGDNVSWQWLPKIAIANDTSLSPIVQPSDDITYQLVVVSANGCPPATDEVFVRVFKKVVVPNAFSPNGDGINDTWRIEALLSYPEATIEVFDRYGRLVFHSKGYKNAWDGNINGNPVPAGMYYYMIISKNGDLDLKGSVLIIR